MNFLLINNEARISQFIKKGLQTNSYNVDVVTNGNGGLQHALYGHYDAIMIDVDLPDIDGYKLCRSIRNKHKSIPIMMLSDSYKLEDKLQSFEIGADDYLIKPFAFEELLARLKAMQRRIHKSEENQHIMIADLMLNNNTHQVTRGGKAIQLTPKEFSLLLYLMKRTDRVLCRTMIEEQVWGNHIDSLTNIVDVYIRRLRKKIDNNNSTKLIHTIWGIGYQLRAE